MDVAWLSVERRDQILMLGNSEPVCASGRITALCRVPTLDFDLASNAQLRFGFLVFHEGGALVTGGYLGGSAAETTGGAVAVEGTLPPVRAAASLWPDSGSAGEVVALITGGEIPPRAPSEAQAEPPPWVTSAQIQLAWLRGQTLVVGQPEALTGTNPWMVRAGKFAGEEDNLLVGVYTSAPFDAVIRRRPWIYRVNRGSDALPHLDPRWRGTSFSRPFRDATFGDLSGEGVGDIAALEVTEDGARSLTVYHFEGFGLEGMADSVDLPPVGDRIEAANWVGGHAHELVVRTTGGRFLFFGLDREGSELREVLAVDGPATVLGWTITSASEGEPGELVCVLPDGEVWRSNSWEHR